MRPGLLTTSALFIALLTLAGSASADSTTRPTQSHDWTPKEICAALARREARLQNCSFEFTEDCRYFHVGKPDEYVVSTHDALVKRKNGLLYMDLSGTHLYSPDYKHLLQAWDGSVTRTFIKDTGANGRADLRGRVENHRPEALSDIRFFGILGMTQGQTDWPRSRWIGSMLEEKGVEVKVTEVATDEGPCVQLTIQQSDRLPPIRYTFSFLPDKDFLPIGFNSTLVNPRQGERDEVSWHVDQLKQLDGFWMPVETSLTNIGGDDGNRCRVILKAFALKEPVNSEMQVEFPVGTQVMDNVNKQLYTLGPNGQRKYERFFDSDTGKMVTPEAQASSKPIIDDTLGKPAPPFPAAASQWLNSKPIQWSDLKGKPVILDFWAEWCGPCRNDLPLAAKIQDESAQSGILIIGIHPSGSKTDAIQKVMAQFNMHGPTCIDAPPPPGSKMWGLLYTQFGIEAIPQSILVDPNGKIVARGSLGQMRSRAAELMEPQPSK